MTALLTLVTGAVLYLMDVQGVATNFIHLADVCLLCLGDCLMLLGVLMLIFETVLPLTVKVISLTFMKLMQSCRYDTRIVAACAHGWRLRLQRSACSALDPKLTDLQRCVNQS